MNNYILPTMSRVIVVIGGTHRGKSTFIKSKIKDKSNIIYDVKGEYTEKGHKVWRNVSNREDFFSHVINNITHHCVVLEEATFYLGTRHYSSQAERILVNKWKSKNVIFIVYHGIEKMPTSLYIFIDYLVLFKTGDNITKIKDHPKKVLQAFQEVNIKSKTDKHYKKIIQLDDMDK
jgi:GTPase SAR1 family protein